MNKNYLIFSLLWIITLTVAKAAFTDASCTGGGDLASVCVLNSTYSFIDGELINGTGTLIINTTGLITNTTPLKSVIINFTTVNISGNITGGNITILATNINILAGGNINATGLGFPSDTGPGNSTATNPYYKPTGGASHAGQAGQGSSFSTGGNIIYGNYLAPITFGSGAGRETYAASTWLGGSGGGIIYINVTGTLNIIGSITATGNNGFGKAAEEATGGGSGGSIYIIANTLTGTGNISADGGVGFNAGANYRGGGGSGGRIAVYMATDSFTGLLTAYGGNMSGGTQGASNGAAGTIYKKLDSALYGDLIIDNNNYVTMGYNNLAIVGAKTTRLLSGTYTFDNITLKNQGHLEIDNQNILLNLSNTNIIGDGKPYSRITNNGNITIPANFNISNWTFAVNNGSILNGLVNLSIINGGTLTHTPYSNYAILYFLNMSLSNLIIDSTSSINVTVGGYTSGSGLGNSTGSATYYTGTGGAGHGGTGGNGLTTVGGATYGDRFAPILPGSGGGFNSYYSFWGGAGGGVVILNVTGTLNNSGTISSNGGNGVGASGNAATGGGSGGSIYITTNILTGTGNIQSKGGNGFQTAYMGGGGAGGRIAIYENQYTGNISVTYNGGLASAPAVIGNVGSYNFPLYNSTGGYDGSGAYIFDGIAGSILSVVSQTKSTMSLWLQNNTGWYHLVNVSGTMYVNGVPATPNEFPMFISGNNVSIGMKSATTFFNGTIDGVKILSINLTSAQVLQLYNGTLNNSNYIDAYANQGTYNSLVWYNTSSTYWNTTFSVVDTYSPRSGVVTVNNEIDITHPNLVGYWKLDGNYLDSTNRRNGTGYGIVYNATGLTSRAMGFNGASDIEIAKDTGLNLINMTMSIWIKLDSATTSNQWFFNKFTYVDAGNNKGYGLNYGADADNIVFYLGRNAANSGLVSARTINDVNWHHIVGTYNGTHKVLYIDGAYDNIQAYGNPVTSAINLTIGAYTSGSSGIKGQCDEALLYNTSLTAAEVNQLYKSGLSHHANTNVTVQFRTTDTYNITDANLISVWGLNGDVIDEANRNNGSCTGINCPVYNNTLGVVGGAMQFDGINDYIQINHSSTLHPTTNFTISTWIKTSSTASNGIFEDNSNAPTNYVGLSLLMKGNVAPCTVAGTIGIYLGNITEGYVCTSQTVNNGIWHHVAVTYNGSLASIYIDGTLSASGTRRVQGLSGYSGNAYIGISTDLTSRPFNGSIDELRFYNRSLSASEILNLYQLDNFHINWSQWEDEKTVSDGIPTGTLASSKFMQYKVILNSNDTTSTPYVLNYSIPNGVTCQYFTSDMGTYCLLSTGYYPTNNEVISFTKNFTVDTNGIILNSNRQNFNITSAGYMFIKGIISSSSTTGAGNITFNSAEFNVTGNITAIGTSTNAQSNGGHIYVDATSINMNGIMNTSVSTQTAGGARMGHSGNITLNSSGPINIGGTIDMNGGTILSSGGGSGGNSSSLILDSEGNINITGNITARGGVGYSTCLAANYGYSGDSGRFIVNEPLYNLSMSGTLWFTVAYRNPCKIAAWLPSNINVSTLTAGSSGGQRMAGNINSTNFIIQNGPFGSFIASALTSNPTSSGDLTITTTIFNLTNTGILSSNGSNASILAGIQTAGASGNINITAVDIYIDGNLTFNAGDYDGGTGGNNGANSSIVILNATNNISINGNIVGRGGRSYTCGAGYGYRGNGGNLTIYGKNITITSVINLSAGNTGCTQYTAGKAGDLSIIASSILNISNKIDQTGTNASVAPNGSTYIKYADALYMNGTTITQNPFITKDNNFGKLEFIQRIGNYSTNDYQAGINITANNISVGSIAYPALNVSANLTFYNNPYVNQPNVLILRNDYQCNASTSPSCYNLTLLNVTNPTFNVSSFTYYSLGLSAALIDLCSYTSGNWYLQCSYYCNLSAVNLMRYNFTLNGTGEIRGISNLTNYTYGEVREGCKVYW